MNVQSLTLPNWSKLELDLNCDMGESYGRFQVGQDAGLMPFITSANLACGAHGGDPLTLMKTVDLALEHRVALGAHPSFPDLAGFGRREMMLSSKEIYALTLHQVAAVQGVVTARRGLLRHVKAHGALYNHLERNLEAAVSFARAIHDLNPELKLYCLSGGKLAGIATGVGLTVVHEVFADRRYSKNGRLAPRNAEGSVLESVKGALEQVGQLLEKGTVSTLEGETIPLKAETLCIHGDGKNALELARAVRELLNTRGFKVRSPR
jgi:5-oxoprolinase (ATP-hydrolysing) subunit A